MGKWNAKMKFSVTRLGWKYFRNLFSEKIHLSHRNSVFQTIISPLQCRPRFPLKKRQGKFLISSFDTELKTFCFVWLRWENVGFLNSCSPTTRGGQDLFLSTTLSLRFKFEKCRRARMETVVTEQFMALSSILSQAWNYLVGTIYFHLSIVSLWTTNHIDK